jgi:hypothetical protein
VLANPSLLYFDMFSVFSVWDAHKNADFPTEEDLRDVYNLDRVISDMLERSERMNTQVDTMKEEAKAAGIGI